MLRNIIGFTIYFLVVVAINSQSIVSQITLENGLSDIQCFDVFEDSKGYIWIGTRAGVCKYDGKDLLSFDRTDGLQSDHIYSFFEDSKGRIWMVNLNGEPMYILDDVIHSRFTDIFLQNLKSSTIVESICEDERGRLWFVNGTNRIKVLDGVSVLEKEIFDQKQKSEIGAYGVFTYKNEIAIVTDLGIMGYDSDSFELVWSYYFKETKFINRKSIRGNQIVFSEFNKVYIFDIESKKLSKTDFGQIGNSFNDLRVIEDRLFLSTAKGLYELLNNKFLKLALSDQIDNSFISAYEIDAHGNSWVATKDDGVFSISRSEVVASRFSQTGEVTFLNQVDSDSILVGTRDCGFSIWNQNNMLSSLKLPDASCTGITKVLNCEGELWITDANSFHMDVKGDYATLDLYKRDVLYNSRNQKFYCPNDKWLMIVDKMSLDKSKGQNFENLDDLKNYFAVNADGFKKVPINQPYSCSMDTSGTVWIGSESGISYIRDTIVETLKHPDALGSIIDIKIDNNHLLGINYGKGIFDYDLATGSFCTLDKSMGLPTNYVIKIAVDEDDVWVSYVRGICHLKRGNDGFSLVKIYGREHGIPKGSISLISIVDNICHFKVGESLYSIREEAIMQDTLKILLDESPWTGFTDELVEIKYDCNNLSFAKGMTYLYRLLPLDTLWTRTESEKISFQYIPANNYSLEIKADHPLNLPSPISKKNILIKHRWYKSTLFYVTLWFALTSLLAFLIRIDAISFNIVNIKSWLNDYLSKSVETTVKIKDIKGVIQILDTREIIFIKAAGNYLEFQMVADHHISRMTITSAEALLGHYSDIKRVHRSYMANFAKVTAVDHKVLKLMNFSLPYSDTYKSSINEHIDKK